MKCPECEALHCEYILDGSCTHCAIKRLKNETRLQEDIRKWIAGIEKQRLHSFSLETQLSEQQRWKDEALAENAKLKEALLRYMSHERTVLKKTEDLIPDYMSYVSEEYKQAEQALKEKP